MSVLWAEFILYEGGVYDLCMFLGGAYDSCFMFRAELNMGIDVTSFTIVRYYQPKEEHSNLILVRLLCFGKKISNIVLLLSS